jgi:hypothetical protein
MTAKKNGNAGGGYASLQQQPDAAAAKLKRASAIPARREQAAQTA